MPFPLFPTLQDLKEALMNNEDLVLDGNLEPVDELLAVTRTLRGLRCSLDYLRHVPDLLRVPVMLEILRSERIEILSMTACQAPETKQVPNSINLADSDGPLPPIRHLRLHPLALCWWNFLYHIQQLPVTLHILIASLRSSHTLLLDNDHEVTIPQTLNCLQKQTNDKIGNKAVVRSLRPMPDAAIDKCNLQACLAIDKGDPQACLVIDKGDMQADLAAVKGNTLVCLAVEKGDARACLDIVKGNAQACLAVVTGSVRACLAGDKGDGQACFANVKGDARPGLAIVKGDMWPGLAVDKGNTRSCLACDKGVGRASLAFVKGGARACLANVKGDVQPGLANVKGDAQASLAFVKGGHMRTSLTIDKGGVRASPAVVKSGARACLAVVKHDAQASLAVDKGQPPRPKKKRVPALLALNPKR
ncbi:hypothetical protein GGX14DRAFT_663149 [Mycena pura]|uniref:Uncharacterized protein n=1 Tax=Mycena pura TaxID=153505 RepID=A0AAD6VU78_9AGAR|nr:hypothetical protein GGX14DRAFT_663149 [Mycena pura]